MEVKVGTGAWEAVTNDIQLREYKGAVTVYVRYAETLEKEAGASEAYVFTKNNRTDIPTRVLFSYDGTQYMFSSGYSYGTMEISTDNVTYAKATSASQLFDDGNLYIRYAATTIKCF